MHIMSIYHVNPISSQLQDDTLEHYGHQSKKHAGGNNHNFNNYHTNNSSHNNHQPYHGNNRGGGAPRKLELCKFYLMECCAKREKCLYMHSDFPCKFYYLGMTDHDRSTCKFAHGRPLTDQLRNILLKHLETAPKEILGDFRRISRETAVHLLGVQHQQLLVEFGMAPAPLHADDVKEAKENEDKPGAGRRSSRWCETAGRGGSYTEQNHQSGDSESKAQSKYLRNLRSIISSDQMDRLFSMGVDSVEHINQMTVAQLNEIGLSIAQIHEIQLKALQVKSMPAADCDMRVPANRNDPQPFDVDMRRIPKIASPIRKAESLLYIKPSTPAFDYSQYVKDSHIGTETEETSGQFETVQKDAIEKTSQELTSQILAPPLPAVYDPSSVLYPRHISNKIDLSASVTQLINESVAAATDTDSRDVASSHSEQQEPSMTTFEFFNRPQPDDSPCALDQLLKPRPPVQHLVTGDEPSISSTTPRKPPYAPWVSTDSPNQTSALSTTIDNSKKYDHDADDDDEKFEDNRIDGDDNDDAECLADAIYARQANAFTSKDKDMRLSSAAIFLTEKFAQRNGDIDLRMPFKPVMTNYIPAKEIEASFGSHPPIVYKVSFRCVLFYFNI